ncbi:ATP synthase subunit I [Pseudoteredinibacter isoporae]|uniref:ATP synthase protein I n=1 Tax=Pseudoteredinibacter isoporae TaxID=570281 RepID=A0A7X0JRV1_9GAMM|nr:ATP synthase subunit I [Pseudoteredinibacter isoporae]MBB6520196.1 ATP synthase protein I [Pseudoteredinibacter isoporae]
MHSNTIDKPAILRVMLQLFLLSGVISLLVYGLRPIWGQSIMAGACLYIIPQSYFALYAFRFRGARASRLIAQSFYRGEVGKYLLTLVGFACVFNSPVSWSVAVVFAAYAIALLLGSLLQTRAINQVRW